MRDELAVLVHTPLVIDHFRMILRNLERPFVIVSDSKIYDDFDVISFEEAISERFRIAISVHYIAGNSLKESNFRNLALRAINKIAGNKFLDFTHTRFTPLKIAEKNVRLSYGLHLSEWDTADWNRLYDYFLLHGPIDANIFRSKFNKPTFEIGYPRYAVKNDIELEKLKSEWRIDAQERIFLWMPTYGAGSSFRNLPKFLSSIVKHGRLIVRPHPLTTLHEADAISIFKKKFPQVVFDLEATRDLASLYRLADTVIADYGGPVFSAIYLEKNIILLNAKESISDLNITESAALDARKSLASFPSDQFDTFEQILEFVIDGKDKRNVLALKRKYFGHERLDQDSSIERACNALRKIYDFEVAR